MERQKHYSISPKKKKRESPSRLYKRVLGVSVELPMSKVMGIVVEPWMRLLHKVFQDVSGGFAKRTWMFYEKFVSEVIEKIYHLQLQTIKQYSWVKRYKRNIASMMEELKKLVTNSKDHIRVKNLHVAGPLQLGCSVTMSNQLEDVKKVEPCACDDGQDPLPSTPTFHSVNFEQITSTCRMEIFEDHVEPESENDLSGINMDGDDTEIDEGIIESCKGSIVHENNVDDIDDGDTEVNEGIVEKYEGPNMHENNVDKACLEDIDDGDTEVSEGIVEKYEGSNMHENNVDKACLDDIDDGGTVYEDFPHNPVFSYRFTGVKWLKSLGNSHYNSTWENVSKCRVSNGKTEDNALLQGIDLMSDLPKTDTCSNLLVLNEIVGLKVKEEVMLKKGDTLNESAVSLKVEDKVNLKEEDILNDSVDLTIENKVKLKGEDNWRNRSEKRQDRFTAKLLHIPKKKIVKLENGEGPAKDQNSCSSHMVYTCTLPAFLALTDLIVTAIQADWQRTANKKCQVTAGKGQQFLMKIILSLKA